MGVVQVATLKFSVPNFFSKAIEFVREKKVYKT